MKQLTKPLTCRGKHLYHTNETARRAVKRRNKAAGYKYLRKYQCNVCGFWHVTSQDKVSDMVVTNQEANTRLSNPPSKPTGESSK